MEKASALRKRVAPGVPLTLHLKETDGSSFTRSLILTFDFNAVAEVEELTGLSLLDGQVWRKPSAKVLRAMLWAAALAHHPEYAEDKDMGLDVIGSYLDASNAVEITSKLFEAFVLSLPEEQRKAIRQEQTKSVTDPTLPAPEKAAAAG